jgi:hypothetical protein
VSKLSKSILFSFSAAKTLTLEIEALENPDPVLENSGLKNLVLGDPAVESPAVKNDSRAGAKRLSSTTSANSAIRSRDF